MFKSDIIPAIAGEQKETQNVPPKFAESDIYTAMNRLVYFYLSIMNELPITSNLHYFSFRIWATSYGV